MTLSSHIKKIGRCCAVVTSLVMATVLFTSGKRSAYSEVIAPRPLNIVFIGNSITHGATLSHPESEAPPVHAAVYLRGKPGLGKVQFSNQGVSGFTTVDFLPATGTAFKHVVDAANTFAGNRQAILIFSIMLGTNDSAIKGPNGSPVSPENYRKNLQVIIDRLLHDYPEARVIIHHPIWYSPNTYNGSEYMQEGLMRLQSYFPEIDTLVKAYDTANPDQVFLGDQKAFGYFKKNHQSLYTPEKGRRGLFYLHPNADGAAKLGILWAKAIYKVVSR